VLVVQCTQTDKIQQSINQTFSQKYKCKREKSINFPFALPTMENIEHKKMPVPEKTQIRAT
jgi:hypothetical protein